MLLFLERFDDKYDVDNTKISINSQNLPAQPRPIRTFQVVHKTWLLQVRMWTDTTWWPPVGEKKVMYHGQIYIILQLSTFTHIHNFIAGDTQHLRPRYCMIVWFIPFQMRLAKLCGKKVNTITANALLFKVAIWSNAPVLEIPKPREMD